jgi:hypothetical protein
MNVFHIPAMLWQVRRQLQVQKHFMQAHLKPFLHEHLASNDGSIDADDIRKIEKYYGLAVPAILGEAFAQLRGMQLSHTERLAATFLGASTGLYDDLFDKKQLPDDYINNMFHHTDTISPQNNFEKMLMASWGRTKDLCASKELLAHYAIGIHQLQIETKQQQTGHLSTEAIERLTFDKGGYSVLLYMSLFYRSMPVADEKMYYNAGALLQLENDIFDVYKDSMAGIKTLVTQGKDMAVLRALYAQKWGEVKESIHQTAYSAKGKKAFTRMLCAIVSRGFVCLDMLEKRQSENTGIFDPLVFERKKLICDMEKPVNLLRTIHYYCFTL